MADDETNKTFKILNATLTTRDVLVARVLNTARADKRLNVVISLALENYFQTDEGRGAAAMALKMSYEELAVHFPPKVAGVLNDGDLESFEAVEPAVIETAKKAIPEAPHAVGKGSISFDALVSA